MSVLQYINGQRLNVTSVLPRATLNTHFNTSDGSCQAVVQGSVQRQGQWNVYGQCLAEIRSQGNTYHKMQYGQQMLLLLTNPCIGHLQKACKMRMTMLKALSQGTAPHVALHIDPVHMHLYVCVCVSLYNKH